MMMTQMTHSVRKETSMDKPRAAQLLRLEILRREALARASSFPADHLQVAQALTRGLEQAAGLADTIVYELLTSISPRVPRICLEGGKIAD